MLFLSSSTPVNPVQLKLILYNPSQASPTSSPLKSQKAPKETFSPQKLSSLLPTSYPISFRLNIHVAGEIN
jgi:hypothetical protein